MNRISRFVKIPTSFNSLELLTIGTPEILYFPINLSASKADASGVK